MNNTHIRHITTISGKIYMPISLNSRVPYKWKIFSKNLKPYKKILFPVLERITFGEYIRKIFIFYFIEFDVFGTIINCFSVNADAFCPLL